MKYTRKCGKIIPKLNAYMDNELAHMPASFVQAHLSNCPECRKEYNRLTALNDNLATLKIAECPDSIKIKLKSIPGRKTAEIKRIRLMYYLRPLPIAASFLLTLAAAGFLGRNLNIDQQANDTVSNDYLLSQESLYTVWQEVYDD